MTEIPCIDWPPITQAATTPLPALLRELERLEYASADELVAGQQQQLGVLSAWFAEHSMFYQRRLAAAGFDVHRPLTLTLLTQLPPITRRDLQTAGNDLFCEPPPSHLPQCETRTSGSSGEPVIVRRTMVNQLFWLAYGMREHLWWQRDFSGTLAIIRASLGQQRISQDSWGPPASLLTQTGPGHAFSMSLDTTTQARLLAELDPHYLLTYPNHLADLLNQVELHQLAWPALRQIRSIGETLTDELRRQARRILGVEITDIYSSQELGVIAIQCPTSGLYHLMAENLLVEVLDEQGKACVPGETGEVVVTDLHNFATPLIRYAIGDQAEVGPVCLCGRQLPTLQRIRGRNRNMVVYPDGTRRWPLVGFYRYREVAPVLQYQLVQHSLHAIEMRLVVERPLVIAEEYALRDLIRAALAYPFDISFTYFSERIPRGPGGKFDEFVCKL